MLDLCWKFSSVVDNRLIFWVEDFPWRKDRIRFLGRVRKKVSEKKKKKTRTFSFFGLVASLEMTHLTKQKCFLKKQVTLPMYGEEIE